MSLHPCPWCGNTRRSVSHVKDHSGDGASNLAGCAALVLAIPTFGLSLVAAVLLTLLNPRPVIGTRIFCPRCRMTEVYDRLGVRVQ